MKRITIHTTSHKSKLLTFAKNAAERNLCIIEKKYHTGDYSVKLTWETSATSAFIQALILLLYDIATHENPIYRHSPKLRDLAEGLQGTPLHKCDTEQLKAFLRTNKDLHIDGYAAFRMETYRANLDMMLYKIIKKINSTK